MRKRAYKQSGMTLIELVIVLGLLAVMATYALTSLEGLSDRSRVDTTTQRLDMLKQAIAGDGLTYSRFISDMGRLPVARDTTEGMEFCELWDSIWCTGTSATLTYDGVSSDISLGLGISEFEISFDGWRGPYIEVSSEGLFDGFGNGFVNPVNPYDPNRGWTKNDPITGVISLGRDFTKDSGGETWENADDCCGGFENKSLAKLVIVIRTKDVSGIWQIPETYDDTAKAWEPSFPYSPTAGEKFAQESGKKLYYCCRSSGNGLSGSGSTPLGSDDEIVKDNDLLWTNRHQYFNRMRVAVFAPYASGTGDTPGLSVRVIEAQKGDTELLTDNKTGEPGITTVTPEWTGMGEITLDNLPVGIRKLYVYGYVSAESVISNQWASSLQTVELKPGENFLKVYLTTPLD